MSKNEAPLTTNKFITMCKMDPNHDGDVGFRGHESVLGKPQDQTLENLKQWKFEILTQ